MKRFTIPALAAVAMAGALSATMTPVSAQSRAKATNVPTIPHEAVPGFFKNPPGIYTGENMGISTDSKGNIYTTETYEGKRLQKFTYAGLGAATFMDGTSAPTGLP